MDVLRDMNPMYRKDFIPKTDNYNLLVLPSNKVVKFLRKQDKICSYEIPKADYFSNLNNSDNTKNKVRITHVVEKGEFFHKIALRYGCSIENIKTWNGF